MVTIDDFKKLELKVAEIKDARPHPNADKLYVLDIEVAGEPRQIIAGIRPYYSEEELKGKKIVIVANLQPAVIRGVESCGMLLAASDGNELSLITPERPVPASAVVR